jgi:hypothetical protein
MLMRIYSTAFPIIRCHPQDLIDKSETTVVYELAAEVPEILLLNIKITLTCRLESILASTKIS